jgi:hypothetical protein
VFSKRKKALATRTLVIAEEGRCTPVGVVAEGEGEKRGGGGGVEGRRRWLGDDELDDDDEAEQCLASQHCIALCRVDVPRKRQRGTIDPVSPNTAWVEVDH